MRYARVVLLETTVQAATEDDIKDDGTLPDVYDGIPIESLPPHVEDVQDYEHIWNIEEA